MKYSQLFILIFAIAWVFIPLTPQQRIISLGFIAIYLSIHNFIGFKLAEKGQSTMKKLNLFQKKLGEKWGLRIYLIFFVLFPVSIGLYVLFAALSMYLK